ncbi:uncharacterized protein LOC110437072 [Sorghum bicolor]|uniref:uncharacterized protein LOC110437072 n=1 Tax=Sorghum bicolor TaxID=4558 RepID=UPI000B426ACD|nr:uncharacterized protein LOC110437072 [Sorghum bicolor]|eukprot:XP_021320897.1 uncharacterized protein LOC110437072 [Sorghum bicolor]
MSASAVAVCVRRQIPELLGAPQPRCEVDGEEQLQPSLPSRCGGLRRRRLLLWHTASGLSTDTQAGLLKRGITFDKLLTVPENDSSVDEDAWPVSILYSSLTILPAPLKLLNSQLLRIPVRPGGR